MFNTISKFDSDIAGDDNNNISPPTSSEESAQYFPIECFILQLKVCRLIDTQIWKDSRVALQ